MKIRLSNGELLSKYCRNKGQYLRARKFYQDGYSADEALEISKENPNNRVERNKTVQLDIYYNTLCRINDEIKKELDPEIRMARVERMVSEAITGWNVVGYTNRLNGGL